MGLITPVALTTGPTSRRATRITSAPGGSLAERLAKTRRSNTDAKERMPMTAAAQTGFFIDLSTARVPPQTAPKVPVLLRMEWTKISQHSPRLELVGLVARASLPSERPQAKSIRHKSRRGRERWRDRGRSPAPPRLPQHHAA